MPETPQNDSLESLGLPPIDQVGFVVKSLDEAEKPVSYTHLTLPTICSV